MLAARAISVFAALWLGMLWTICGVVATSLFAILDDRRLAGTIAGEFFHIATWLGVASGALLWLLLAVRRSASRTLVTWIAVTALPPLANELALLPFMGTAREAGNMALFGMLHLGSVALFAVACLGALMLVLRLTRPAG